MINTQNRTRGTKMDARTLNEELIYKIHETGRKTFGKEKNR